MDPRQRFRHHYPQTEIARSDDRMLARGPLTVVVPTDDRVPSDVVGGTGGIGVIDLDIDELGDLRDVRPIRQNAGSGGHDLIGGDVVADLEQDLQIDVIGQRFEVRQGRDVRSLHELDRPGFLRSQRWDEHLAVRGVLLG